MSDRPLPTPPGPSSSQFSTSDEPRASAPMPTHPPRIATLLPAGDDGWGGLIQEEKPMTEKEKREEEVLLKRVRSLENRKSNASKLAQELTDLEARLAAAEEKERSLREGKENVIPSAQGRV